MSKPKRLKADRIDKEIGARIKAARDAKGWSLIDLAVKFKEVSSQQLGKYELGTDRIRASLLFKLAKVLGVKPAQLFPG